MPTEKKTSSKTKTGSESAESKSTSKKKKKKKKSTEKSDSKSKSSSAKKDRENSETKEKSSGKKETSSESSSSSRSKKRSESEEEKSSRREERAEKEEQTAQADSAASDTAQADTAHIAAEPDTVPPVPSMALTTDPGALPVNSYPDSLSSIPWLVTVLLLLFVTLSVRYKNNFSFLRAMVSDLVTVRRRANRFDDTVRETSFVITLDVLCVAEVAIIGMTALMHFVPSTAALPLAHTLGMSAICAAGLYLFQWISYNLSAYIFSDTESRHAWVRAFAVSQGLLAIVLFPIALAVIFNPHCVPWLIWVGFAAFVLARIVFIYKGFRIFFAQSGSWVLFLYYLCSLEVVPLILAAVALQALAMQ